VKCLEEDNVALIASLKFTQDDLKKEKEQVETCKKDMEDMGDAMTKMGQMVGCHGVNIETLEEKATKSDIFQRGKNVLFRGVPEDRGDSMDDCLRKVDNVLSRWMDLEPSTIKVNRCHRVGPPPPGQSMATAEDPLDQCWSNSTGALTGLKYWKEGTCWLGQAFPLKKTIQ
jgi:hypothetical protein